MTVVVAGAAGFIGSHVCREVLRRGCQVVCLDYLLSVDATHSDDMGRNPRFAFVECDTDNAPNLSVDVVLYLESPASPRHRMRLPIETMLADLLATLRLPPVAAECGALFTYASTPVHSDPLVHPQSESYSRNVDPSGLRACCDESKRLDERSHMPDEIAFTAEEVPRLLSCDG